MRKLILVTIGVVALTTGCSGVGSNQQMGTLTGAVAGGLLGNAIGKGNGRVASTAIGTFLGTVVGSEVGKSMHRPTTVAYRTSSTAQTAYGVCADITNEGAQSSCKRGVADRLRQEQRRLERDAYSRGYGR